MTERMPALFMGHGNPMNSITDNVWSRAWVALGQALPRPRAVLCISAHWYVGETAVTAMGRPRTVHDFGGFPRELFAVEYPAPGDPALARRVQALLAPTPVRADLEWGLDHGAWSVLRRMFPAADVPVVQLSLDATQPPAVHYALGQRLAQLRDEGILLLASGNVVHNLRVYAWGDEAAAPFDWTVRFEAKVRELILKGDHAALANTSTLGPDAALAIPTPDHYLPLLYALGASRSDDKVTFPTDGADGGSMSMLSVRWG